MLDSQYKYVIVGAGLAGGAAVDGIREVDAEGSILLIGQESYLPYNRPPLTKGLWSGKKTIEKIFLHPDQYYADHGATVLTETEVVAIDPNDCRITDQHGRCARYEKLLLATGGTPRRLTIPGAELEGICYYRYLSDFVRLRVDAQRGATALVIGGGFIGSELAAALQTNGVNVTMLFPDAYLVSRVFPEGLGRALTNQYANRGVTIFANDTPATIERKDGKYFTQTHDGRQITTDLLVIGAGIRPLDELARMAGLQVENGIVVNSLLETSMPGIYAAGDIASFPYLALGKQMRVEHWDNAIMMGKWAGRNMAGAEQPYDYMPYFYSDLFEFGYEAVGDVSSKLATYSDLPGNGETGVIYYLQDNQVRGVMLCNIFGKVEEARTLIRQGVRVGRPEELAGRITAQKKAA